MTSASSSLVLLLWVHGVHESSAARERPGLINLQAVHHAADNGDDTLSDASQRAGHINSSVEYNFIVATWHRSLIEFSSLMDGAVRQDGGIVSALLWKSFAVLVALVLLISVCMYVCGAHALPKLLNESGYSSSGSDTPSGPYPSPNIGQLQTLDQKCEVQPSLLKDVDYEEVIKRLSQTIKKVPTSSMSNSFYRWFGVGSQERHLAVWWGAEEPTWPTARLGWWKSKQEHLADKAPKGDLVLKDVRRVRLASNHEGYSDPAVCVTHDDGVDLLLFFPDSSVAEQFAEDLLLLVRKVKKVSKADAVLRKLH